MATKTNVNEVVNNGSWSSSAPKIPMIYMHVEIEWLEKALGTTPNNPDLLGDYIASKAPDAKSKEEEIAAIGESEVKDKQICVYPKGTFVFDPVSERYIDELDVNITLSDEDENGNIKWAHEGDAVSGEGYRISKIPYYYNYQIRGFFKDSCALLSKSDEVDENGKKIGTTESAKLKAYKKVIDGGIFVFPRRIGINVPSHFIDDDGSTIVPSYTDDGNLQVVQRSLRTSGPSGERNAIAVSEMIPAGSRMKFTIGMTSPKFKPAVIEWLNYAAVHGISGWRNSGLGIFRWREIQKNYSPFESSEELNAEE